MKVYIGADHRGFTLKEFLKDALIGKSYDVVDEGDMAYDPGDDYPLFAAAVAKAVADTAGARGIVICGSGFGVDIVANKFRGIRSALATSPEQIRLGRHDDDVNVLALPADFVDKALALEIVDVFLATSFAKEEKYSRRLGEISGIEKKL